MNIYEIFDIDVWGSGEEENEWEHNNYFPRGEVDLTSKNSEQILRYLIDEGFLTESAITEAYVDWNVGSGENLTICQLSDNYPIYYLREKI